MLMQISMGGQSLILIRADGGLMIGSNGECAEGEIFSENYAAFFLPFAELWKAVRTMESSVSMKHPHGHLRIGLAQGVVDSQAVEITTWGGGKEKMSFTMSKKLLFEAVGLKI